MKQRFFAIVNPAAGGGRAAKLASDAIKNLRETGLQIDVIASTAPGHSSQLASEAYQQGYRRFLAVGGDGTAHEVINGIFLRDDASTEHVELGFLPFGTGNSFLRHFQEDGLGDPLKALTIGRKRPIDLLRLRHSTGTIYSFNLLSVGFTAEVGALTNRHFKSLGQAGYLLGVFVRVVQLQRRTFKTRSDNDATWDDRCCLFLTFNNTKYTGGTMKIAPQAIPDDGLIDFVRWGPIGRTALVTTLPRLYTGTHDKHPLCETRKVKQVQFALAGPLDVLIDGEIVTLQCEVLDILPAALDVFV